MQFQKISILPEQNRLNFLGVRGSLKTKNLKKWMKPGANFHRDGEGVLKKKNPLWGSMDIFWGYTLYLPQK